MFLSKRALEMSTNYNLCGSIQKIHCHSHFTYSLSRPQVLIGYDMYSTSGPMVRIPWQALDTLSTNYNRKK